MSREQEEHGNGSFIFGLILGAVIGAVIAILIYRNDKDKTIQKLKATLEGWFAKLFPQSSKKTPSKPSKRKLIAHKEKTSSPKIEVELPPSLAAATPPVPVKRPVKLRTFKRK